MNKEVKLRCPSVRETRRFAGALKAASQGDRRLWNRYQRDLEWGDLIYRPRCVQPVKRIASLWHWFRCQVPEVGRSRLGQRHRQATVLAIFSFAVDAFIGDFPAERGFEWIWFYAQSMARKKREAARCWRNKRGKYEIPGRRTFRRVVKAVGFNRIRRTFEAWDADRKRLFDQRGRAPANIRAPFVPAVPQAA